jgi:hypothetical protein
MILTKLLKKYGNIPVTIQSKLVINKNLKCNDTGIDLYKVRIPTDLTVKNSIVYWRDF